MKLRYCISLLLVAVFFLSACGSTIPTPTATPQTGVTPSATGEIELTPIDVKVGYGVRDSWFELYFTDPANPTSTQGTGGVDGPLVDAIDTARMSIDVAAYSL